MNTTNGLKIAVDFEEDATIKELVGKDGNLEEIIEQAETGLEDGFLDYFLEDGAASEDPLCHLLDQICTEDVVEKENDENKDPSGNGLYGEQHFNALTFGVYQNQQVDSSIGPIRQTEKKRMFSKPYEIGAPGHAAVIRDITAEELKNRLDTPVADAIDTRKTVGDVKNWLKMNGINQTKFAEMVLEKTQGHFSVISRNPAPWEELLAPGRAVFVRMHNWMKLSEEEKNKILSVEKVSMRKDLQEKMKKTRFTFSKEQMEVLMGIYEINNRPGKELIEELAAKFSLSFNQIKDFFLNRRRRAKKSNL
ncbi:hypothetical protein GCK72_012720 [Caenorhabditis remanei]|uniref:One cut domain family member n=1 Tax=Caenorhabditis remanei TaxID=31234 RepID=A0A6A5GLW7_CAERE|nr:hypothetical protein GCK72_012720 [Caenorhabditis remanei]KAF1756267.1 hypothetical protein GCK72_012720 [Caenorhabditis remanei]